MRGISSAKHGKPASHCTGAQDLKLILSVHFIDFKLFDVKLWQMVSEVPALGSDGRLRTPTTTAPAQIPISFVHRTLPWVRDSGICHITSPSSETGITSSEWRPTQVKWSPNDTKCRASLLMSSCQVDIHVIVLFSILGFYPNGEDLIHFSCTHKFSSARSWLVRLFFLLLSPKQLECFPMRRANRRTIPPTPCMLSRFCNIGSVFVPSFPCDKESLARLSLRSVQARLAACAGFPAGSFYSPLPLRVPM